VGTSTCGKLIPNYQPPPKKNNIIIIINKQ
jgi:hypothetical protein